MGAFVQVTLRTTDVAAAKQFYAAVLGADQPLDIVPLHEQALAKGAKPHWLGFIEVPDVDAATTAQLARGGMPLGPKWVNPEGLEAAVMRDAGGAVVAFCKPKTKRPTPIVWHLLNTPDVDAAKAAYQAIAGWSFGEEVNLGEHGTSHTFSWTGAEPVGGVMSTKGRSNVHPHWLFHFATNDLDASVAAVRAGKGLVVGPFTLPSGARVAVCDDAQGAAFALLSR